MDSGRAPWNPDPRWADPLIAFLALLALAASALVLGARDGRRKVALAETASPQLRVVEIQLDFARQGEALRPGLVAKTLGDVERQLKEPWDRAGLAVEAEEAKETALAQRLAESLPKEPAFDSFRAQLAAAYGGGALVAETPPKALEGTAAGIRLQNRLRSRLGEAPLPLPPSRMGFFLLVGVGAFLLFFGGVAFGIFLLATRTQPRPPAPAWTMPGRAVLLVFLGWFAAYFLGNVLVAKLMPSLGRAWALPLGYLLHAAAGTWLICRAEGLSFGELVAKVGSGPLGRKLAWGAGFLSLAVCLVVLVAIALSPILKNHPGSQQELTDLLRDVRGWAPKLALFLTVAGLAPLFEELMFRGFLLPWLGERWGWGWGLALSSLLFGAIHLEPWALPILATLGFALGLAMSRSRSLWSSVLVHACWNGSVFLLVRMAG